METDIVVSEYSSQCILPFNNLMYSYVRIIYVCTFNPPCLVYAIMNVVTYIHDSSLKNKYNTVHVIINVAQW